MANEYIKNIPWDGMKYSSKIFSYSPISIIEIDVIG
jgi:hypothetical protein